jgi:hypothetical protein
MMQVTSRGCSRSYIICVLWHGWEHVRYLKANDLPVCFPFPEEVVTGWLTAARNDCSQSPQFLNVFGGTEYCDEDKSTFWSIPSHFFTW